MKKLIRCSNDHAVYYHYDDREFEVGGIITGHVYGIPKDIFIQYSSDNSEIRDMSRVVYCLDHQDPDYASEYKYCYVVKANQMYRRRLDCSIVVCAEDIDKILRSAGFNTDDMYARRSFIRSMSKAYLGHEASMNVLASKYNFCVSDHVEYISDEVEVVDVVK